MGGHTAIQRMKMTKNTLQDAIELLQNIATAIQQDFMRKSLEITYAEAPSSEPFIHNEAENTLKIFSNDIKHAKKVIPLIIKPKRAYKIFFEDSKANSISWKAIQETSMQ